MYSQWLSSLPECTGERIALIHPRLVLSALLLDGRGRGAVGPTLSLVGHVALGSFRLGRKSYGGGLGRRRGSDQLFATRVVATGVTWHLWKRFVIMFGLRWRLRMDAAVLRLVVLRLRIPWL